MKAITPHYIDGKFVEPHGREVVDSREALAPGFADLSQYDATTHFVG
jgi:hypothetical protein